MFFEVAASTVVTTFTVFSFLYADPGSGTLILQLLAGAFFGLLFYARFFTRRARKLFSRKKAEDDLDDS